MNNFPSSCTSNSQFCTSSSRSCVVSDNKKDVKTIKKGNSGNNNNSSSAKRSSSNKGVMKLSTDPQSVAARERRHRISDRFKILQSLVPGGAKMDTVSMLEEAIHYVKFLKTQIWLHQTMINCQFVDDQEYYYSLQDGQNPPTMFLTPPDHHDHQTTLDHDSANNNAVLEHHHQQQHQLPEMPMVPDNYCFDHDHHHQHQGHETTLFGHANYVRYN